MENLSSCLLTDANTSQFATSAQPMQSMQPAQSTQHSNSSVFLTEEEYEVAVSQTVEKNNVRVMNDCSTTTLLEYVEENRLTMNEGRPFHVMDIRAVEQRHAKWAHHLPRADIFYAMKCNTDPVLLQTLFARGAGFDCASRREIELALGVGCKAERIIFANPAKLTSDLEFAASVGITKMTFDSEDELYKIADAYKRCGNGLVPEPVIRIITDDSMSMCKFSAKFGADIDDCVHLLTVAAKLNLPVIGVSFHVGSGCANIYSFTKAIHDARRVFDEGLEIGHPMHFLDLGGGWPGDDNGKITFASIANAIRPLMDEHFPVNAPTKQVASLTGSVIPPIHIIAEPGRYFAHASMIFATPIISRRCNLKLPSWTTKQGDANQQPQVLYYIGDGVYGAFNNIIYDHYHPQVRAYYSNPEKQDVYGSARDQLHKLLAIDETRRTEEMTSEIARLSSELGHVRAKVFGPTCDGLDTIFETVPLPMLELNDWLVFDNMGAYTIAAQSSFNGIPRPSVFYIRTSKAVHDFSFVTTSVAASQQSEYVSASLEKPSATLITTALDLQLLPSASSTSADIAEDDYSVAIDLAQPESFEFEQELNEVTL